MRAQLEVMSSYPDPDRADIDARRVSGGRVRSDAEALRCVVRNLLDNARHHADRRVRLALGERGGIVELTVSDAPSG